MKIGLVPIALPADEVQALVDKVDRVEGSEMTVDLEQQTLTAPAGEVLAFPFDAFQRHRLLNGLDDIGLSLRHEEAIAAFEKSHPSPIDTLALR